MPEPIRCAACIYDGMLVARVAITIVRGYAACHEHFNPMVRGLHRIISTPTMLPTTHQRSQKEV